ncbi:MAG: PEP-CTERM/exosortase system-associated acyltransferase [Deltaproteobacteria bacterium]
MIDSEGLIFRKIDSPELLEDVFRLRYQVYCKERQFLSASDYPQEAERDPFDEFSFHFGAFDVSGQLVGAVRLILPECHVFPIEERVPDLGLGDSLPMRGECAEISRLTISKEFRRSLSSGPLWGTGDPLRRTGAILRKVSPIALGLCHLMYLECIEQQIGYCLALMERPLHLLLRLHGFSFRQVGREIDFAGPVAPYIIDVGAMDRRQLFTQLPFGIEEVQ